MPPRPEELRSTGPETTKPKSERRFGYGGQKDCAQTIAEWEPWQRANMDINGRPKLQSGY
jgi:hypothetical protein